MSGFQCEQNTRLAIAFGDPLTLELAGLKHEGVQSKGLPAPLSRSVGISLLEQEHAPVLLVEVTTSTRDVLKRGKLWTGKREILGYRMGWAVVNAAGKAKTHLGNWLLEPTPIEAETEVEIPRHRIPRSFLETEDATEVYFFVVEVAFPDGTTWQANLEDIAKRAAAAAAREPR